MPQRRPWALLARLPLLSTFGVALTFTAMLSGFVLWAMIDARTLVRKAAEQDSKNIALTLERDVGRVITTLDLSLSAAVQGMATPGLASMPPELRQSILFDGAVGAEQFGGIIVTDISGNALYTSVGAARPQMNIADRSSFKAQRDAANLGMTISAPVRSRIDGRWVLDVIRRINDANGAFAGVAVAKLRLDYFQTLFSAIDLGNEGTITLLRTDRILVARRPFSEEDVNRNLEAAQMFRGLADRSSGTYEGIAAIDGVHRLYVYRQIETLPLVLIVGRSTKEIFAAWTGRAILIGSAFVLLSIIGLALAWRLQREFNRRADAERAARQAETEALQLTANLSKALAPIEALFKNSQDFMLSVNVAADGTFTYEAVNPVWESTFGLSNAAVTGRTPEACLPADLTGIILRNWRTCVRERRAVKFEYQTVISPPPRDWEAMAVPVLDETGAVSRLIIIGREMTARNHLEGQLRQAQKMEVIGRLAAGVSHDFNNILQVITGATSLLQDNQGLSETSKNFLVMIDRAARRGAYLTHHLLSYSRKQMLAPKILDVGEVLDTLQPVLSRTLGSHIVVNTSVAASTGLLRADRSQLETALINLAINSAHAMKNGGKLDFNVKSREAELFGELTPGRHVVIAVKDCGIGMTPEIMACVFEPFFTTKGLEGTGLGLAMVQGFARQSGGDVRVESTPGQGTTFEIWLPEVELDVTPTIRHNAQQPHRAENAHILLVDDDEDVLATMAAVLSCGEFTIRQALGGPEALAALQGGERFDILVTDFSMPELNGADLITKARHFQPSIPAVIVTGFSDVTDRVTALPATTVLHKPLRAEELVDCISEQLARAREPVS